MTEQTRCARCGKDPADGWAFHDDRRYCHGDEPGDSCFIAEWHAEWEARPRHPLFEPLRDVLNRRL